MSLEKIELRTFQDLIILETQTDLDSYEVDYDRLDQKRGAEREFAAFLQVQDQYLMLGTLNIYMQSVERDGLWCRTSTSGKDYILGNDAAEQCLFLNFPDAYWEGIERGKKQVVLDSIETAKVRARDERKRKVKRTINKLKVF